MHRRLAVRGVVQGVGLRPWVWQQASDLGLVGWVRNNGTGVEIDLHGEEAGLNTLQERLWQAPAPARIDQIERVPIKAGEDTSARAPSPGKTSDIQASVEGTQARAAIIGTDLGACGRCFAEVFDPTSRRWRYAFSHCPQCGPRYTITRGLPRDRAHTSMARFHPCAACGAEYQDSTDRRFHHETNVCPVCGPRLWLRLPDGSMDTQEPLAATLQLLREGGIVAIKGIGGFHLYCDARQPAAIARLRQRKRREIKPLAVMVANTASLSPWADMSAHERRWLASAERPIVLLRQTASARSELAALAPGLHTLGAMLPYTPMHHLLFHEAAGKPSHTGWQDEPIDCMLAVASGNQPGAPLVMDNATALLELAEMADAWLMHDLDILARNDDSVLRVRPDGSACFLRRGRGYSPTPIALPATGTSPAPSVLALGGLLKTTLCVTQGERAMVSPHVGDLDAVDTRLSCARLADQWPAWLHTQPDALACDLHPDFFSTILAAHLSHTRASATTSASSQAFVPIVQVQHHHAHVAAVLAEHADPKEALAPVIGLAIDEGGLGSDGQTWGGELLRVEGGQARRLGHLRPLPQPGGGDPADQAPWRLAAAVLHELGRGDEIPTRFARHPQAIAVQTWLARAGHPPSPSTNATRTAHSTSLGRLIQAAAGLLDLLSPRVAGDHDAEAAMRLESLAHEAGPAQALPDGWRIGADMVLDWRPLMAWLADETASSRTPHGREASVRLAGIFHATLAEALAQWAQQAARQQGLKTVVLAGGCMACAVLDDALHARLTQAGLHIRRANHYPCGDGGLSLGQAWVARQLLMSQAA